MMESKNTPIGLTRCIKCSKLVPKGVHCLYCGSPLNITIPSIKPLERKILVAMKTLGGELTVSNIHDDTDISKESIRVHLGGLQRFGLVDRASRGKYLLSRLGESTVGSI